MKIIISGAGIGGLTAALLLNEAGYQVSVFESVSEVKPLGVGINTLPHCVRILTNLGLLPKLKEHGVETSDLVYFNKHGQQFWTEPRGKFAGYKWSQFSVHRGTLQMLLFNEVLDKLGKHAIHVNHHLDSFEQSESQVTAHFINKETDEKMNSIKADLLIGADGINSAVRNQLYPNEGPPVYSENVLYRGISKMQKFLNGTSMVMIGHMGQKMVAYPILNEPDENGEYLINWVSNLKEGSSKLSDRDWNREADKNRLVEIYKDWKFDWIDVPEMISKAEKVYEFPMSDRDPLSKWSFGRVTLLGDAAHPMYPIGSNGASQAIIDAEFLTECLKKETNLTEALAQYDKVRVPDTAKVVLQNRKKGPDQIMDMMEEQFPDGFTTEEIPHEALKKVMDNYKVVAGFELESLNQKL